MAAAVAQIAVPPYSARAQDLTGTLDSEQLARLEQKLRAFEERKGSQIAVLIVPTTEPEDIAEFGIRVAESWKPGRKGVDDGAILLVAKNDRRMRIEVGYGLEGVLPDAIAKRIIEETIAPHFKQGDFYGGIDAGLEQMMKVIDGEPLPEPDPAWTPPGVGNWLIVVLVLFVIGASTLRMVLGRVGGALATGGVVGVITYVMTHLIPFAIGFSVVGFLVALLFGIFGGPRGWSSGGRRGGGGWSSGWGGGGGWGGSSGGGFGGGGGGGFGGGGASGGW
jgi:uncharacterized protein